MTVHTMRGGLYDGHMVDVPDGTGVVVFPAISTPARIGRSLAELEPEVRFDQETGAIVAPDELVLRLEQVRYVRSSDGTFAAEKVST